MHKFFPPKESIFFLNKCSNKLHVGLNNLACNSLLTGALNRCEFIKQCVSLVTGAELMPRLARGSDVHGVGIFIQIFCLMGEYTSVSAVLFISYTQVGARIAKGQRRKELSVHSSLPQPSSSSWPSAKYGLSGGFPQLLKPGRAPGATYSEFFVFLSY